MDILKNSLSLARYHLDPSPGLPALHSRVDWTGHAFRPIDHTADQTSLGLVRLDDYEVPLTENPPRLGGYLFLRLRLDTRAIPPAVLARRQSQAIEQKRAALLAQGKSLTREDKKEIRDLVKQRLLAQTEPRPKTISLALLPRELWAFTARPRELAMVEDFVSPMLNLELHPVNLASLPNAGPWTAQVSPHFLTRLFLSQLYRQEQAGDGETRLCICRDVRLTKDKEHMSIQTKNLASWPEIGLSLSKGKTIFQAGLEITLGEERTTLQLRSNWTATRIKTPPLTQNGDPDSALVEKINQLRRIFSTLDALGQDLLPARQNTLAA
jgi:hypothetical protein